MKACRPGVAHVVRVALGADCGRPRLPVDLDDAVHNGLGRGTRRVYSHDLAHAHGRNGLGADQHHVPWLDAGAHRAGQNRLHVPRAEQLSGRDERKDRSGGKHRRHGQNACDLQSQPPEPAFHQLGHH